MEENKFIFTYKVSSYLPSICRVDSSGYFDSPFHIDEKRYLSRSMRKGSLSRAAEFNTKIEAVEFFNQWLNKQKDKGWKLEVVEILLEESVELELYDKSHPLYQLSKELTPHVMKYAYAYFYDYLHDLEFSTATFRKYRKLFLDFDIDITERVKDEWNLVLLRDRKVEAFKASEDYKGCDKQTNKGLKLVTN